MQNMQTFFRIKGFFSSKFTAAIFACLCLFFVGLQNVEAIGQVATPIVIENAVSGQIYENQLTLISNANTNQTYKLIATGDIADWTKFYSIDNPNDSIPTIVIPANSRINAKARFEIPDETPVGTYEGKVVLALAPENASEPKGGVAVSQQISRLVTIKITGQKNAASFVVIRADHDIIPQGDAINFTAQCNNTGNVIIKPLVEIEIFKNNVRVDNIMYPYDKNKKGIIPRQTETLVASWQTGKRELGNYVAAVRVYLGDVVAQETRFPFEITDKPSVIAMASLSAFLKNNLTIIEVASALAVLVVIMVLIVVKKQYIKKVN